MKRNRLMLDRGCHICVIALLALALMPAALRAAPDEPMGIERVARVAPLAYQVGAASGDATVWLQVDLGAQQRIDRVKLLPYTGWGLTSDGFPVRFRIEASDDPAFKTSRTIADQTAADYPEPGDKVAIFAANGASGRYVRLTATKLRQKTLCLSKLEVWSSGKDVAVGRPVSDSVRGSLGPTPLTRTPRPNGEEDVTDNPSNVIPASEWRPVPYGIRPPTSDVTLAPGLFRTAMENNVQYLLGGATVDEMLRQFRDRAGKPNPPGLRKPDPFWDNDLPGSSAGRFLMGAGNTLRWMDNPELRRRMEALVDRIAECRAPDGYIMAYPRDTIFYSERAAYTRSWLTRGLVEAGIGGNAKAFALLRGYYDWFDQNPYLPELLRRGGQGVQGMIANTRVYFTPVGKPEDLQVVQRYFQEDYWLDELAKRQDRAIWQYPYDHPHCYLLTSIEPYLDLYRATGARKYLNAAMGGWDLYHDKWEHVGGAIAICEGDVYPPKSYFLHRHTGELCGSVFWVRLNQRLHCLYPNEERYVAEIEKSIYNVGLANQAGAKGIRYHANLVGHKDAADSKNTCCEGQGTRLLGSLPEYVYSLAPDGVYVDLFAPSRIRWNQRGRAISARMDTTFPYRPAVRLVISATSPTHSVIRIRVPSWATHAMAITVNGRTIVTGRPGSYVPIARTWRDGDTITFTLPMAFRLTRYDGLEQTPGRDRYALEYGPILLALVGDPANNREEAVKCSPAALVSRLRPAGEPLRFAIDGEPGLSYVPYWQVEDQVFTCYPFVGSASSAAATVGADDLALASKGAAARSDSEYANEPGCTARVIDGIVATPADFSNRWHSSLATPHPHWVEVKLPRAAAIGRIVIRFADPAGHPTSFEGLVWVNGKQRTVFDVKQYSEWSRYDAKIQSVVTDTFRLIIRASANPAYPNAAQVSEIELYPPERASAR